MNSKTVDVGRMRHRIHIQTATRTPDGIGGATLVWADARVRWAAVEDTRGQQYGPSNEHRESQRLTRFVCRNSGLFDALNGKDVRILYKSRVYKVTGINRYNHDGFYVAFEVNGNDWENR